MSHKAYLLRYLLITLAASVIAMTGCDYSPELHAAVEARGLAEGHGAQAVASTSAPFVTLAGGENTSGR
ncbi:MAG: hypothetical protein V4633_22210 [Pseudomonadota bacterium]